MDQTKLRIARRVQQLVLNFNWNTTVPHVEDRQNYATAISDLETMIRIWTLSGPRYFVVKLKEQY